MGKARNPSVGQREAPLAIRTEEGKITRHLILSAEKAAPATLDLLHRDLSDERPNVVVSAIRAVGHRSDPRSVPYILPFLENEHIEIALEAVRSLGKLGTEAAVKALVDLGRRSRDDQLRCAALKSLAAVDPSGAPLLQALREYAASPSVAPSLRGCAASLMISLVDPATARELFPTLSTEAVDIVLQEARENPRLRSAIVRFGGAWLDRWSSLNRRRLVTLAGESREQEALSIVLNAIEDADPEVRFAGYRALGIDQGDASKVEEIVVHLLGRWEPDYSLEEEALSAIDRLERDCSRGNATISVSTLIRLRNESEELFRRLTDPPGRPRPSSAQPSVLVGRAREYLEYYVSEDFRRALVHYLEGASLHSADNLLSMLKRSADRIEDRHFEGYRALAEVIKNRTDAATAIRELSSAELGRRVPFGRLIRTLRLMRLSSQPDRQTLDLLARILSWARHERLFRLAEAALVALAKFLPARAIEVSRELLAVPFESKILAITAIRLTAELGTAASVETVLSLLGATADSHILLNLFDALSDVDWAADRRIIEAVVRILVTEQDGEVVREAARFLSRHRSSVAFDITTSDFDHFEAWRQLTVLDMLGRIVDSDPEGSGKTAGMLLQHLLSSGSNVLRGVAAVLLLKIGDQSASRVLIELLESADDDVRVEIIRRLKGNFTVPLTEALLSLLNAEHPGLQQVLREALLEGLNSSVGAYVLQRIGGRVEALAATQSVAVAEVPNEEREITSSPEVREELALFAVNIEGYSNMAPNLPADRLAEVMHDYEGILLPMIDSHRGSLIKRRGGSHLFAFHSALDAALAGLRLQKALKRFNSYREEPLRVQVRVGIHWGQFARRAGDVRGENVEVTGKLEGLAKRGSILVSEALCRRLEGRIHVRELGTVALRAAGEPTKVFEPFEIQVDLPEELDPLKTTGRTIRTESSSTKRTAASETQAALEEFSAEALERLSELFKSLDELCRRVENREVPVSLLRSELRKGWGRIRELFRRRRV